MADKEPQLNGAYYSPMIPPTEPPPREQHCHRGRRCCCCLFGFFWKLLLAIIIFLVLVFLILWAVVRPRVFKIHVSDATLTQFNYTTTTSTLSYNLVLNITARNPNKKLEIYYDRVEANAWYEGVRFNTTLVMTWGNGFRQPTKSTDSTRVVLSGERVMVLDKDHFEEDERRRVFDIHVGLNFHFRYRLGELISHTASKAKVKCDLAVPFTSKPNRSATLFHPTACDLYL